MIWIDYAILAIVGISAVISLLRGFIREALSLVGWIAAFWLALGFAGDVAELLEGRVSVPSLRQAIGFAVLFAGTLLVFGIAIQLVGVLVEKTGLSGTDRTLGIVFGVARGAIVVGLLVVLAGMTALPQDPWWRESVLLPHFERLAVEIRNLLPPEIAQHVRY